LNNNEIPPPYQIIAAVIINVRWETFIWGFRVQGSGFKGSGFRPAAALL
jgi:hypothetical protein